MLLPGIAIAWLPMRGVSKRYSNDDSYLFRQTRIGLGGKPLEIIKFRTIPERAMVRQPSGLPNVIDRRTDKIGNIIRLLGLDEIAQVINVARGDMSMVGPRPLQEEDIDKISGLTNDKKLAEDWRVMRDLAKPGLIGPGQFYIHDNQLNNEPCSREIQMRKDIQYVETASLAGDLKFLGMLPSELVRLGHLALQKGLS